MRDASARIVRPPACQLRRCHVRTVVTLLLAATVVFLAPSTGLAQTPQADVKEAVARIYAALNSANANGVVDRMATGGYTEITADGRRVAIDDSYIRGRVLVGDFRANF